MFDTLWMRPFLIVWVFCIISSTASLASASPLSLSRVSEKHQTDLLTIASEKEALHVFRKKLQADLGLTYSKPQHTRHSSLKHRAPDRQSHILTLMVNLLSSCLAVSIQTNLQQASVANTPQFIDQNIPGYQWAQTQPLSPSIAKTLTFNANLSHYFKTVPPLTQRPPHFDDFALYVDGQYPALTGSPESWIEILEQGDIPTISNRLSEYWKQEPPQGEHSASRPNQQDQADHAHYYAWTRLWPIFKAHLIALTIQAEAEAMHIARQSLRNIKKIQKIQVGKHNHRRICGTWHWTVHNHQNHGDHKMKIVLGNSTQHSAKQPQPTEITINGDTVYLFWKFPRGFQEDSLLLSNNDKRLEGTFKNTLGPYGSIMGKRISTCKP